MILASLDPDEAHYAACDRIVSAGANKIFVPEIGALAGQAMQLG